MLDTYHFGYVLSGAQKTFEVIDGARTNILRTRNLFVGQYGELELSKYPCRLESEAARAKDQKQKKKGSSPQSKLLSAPTLRKLDETTPSSGVKAGGASEKAKSGPGAKRDAAKRKGHLRSFNFRQLLVAARAERRAEGGLDDEDDRPESERLLDLGEVEQVYVALGLPAPDLGWYDPAPHIDVAETLARMQERPGRLYQVHS